MLDKSCFPRNESELPARATQYSAARLSRPWLICIAAAATLAFVFKVILALNTYGTNDVMTWEQDLIKIDARGPAVLYREGVQSFSVNGKAYYAQPFIHPPFMIHALRFWALIARITHLPMRFWMRFTCAVADIGSLVVVCGIVRHSPALRPQPVMILLLALCPISIMISGFHGNTDPIMIFLILMSIYTMQARRSAVLAAIFMGLALSVKIVPVIFIPALLLNFTRMRDRVSFVISSVIVFFVSSLPYVVSDTYLVLSKLFTYSSLTGLWGWSRIALLIEHDARYDWIYRAVDANGKQVLLICIVLLSIAMRMSKARLPLLAQCGLITALFMFFTPGFGLQYLSWLAPWVVCLTPAVASAYYVTGGTFLFVVYTRWSGGIPWYLANSLETPDWSKAGVCLGLLCWLVTGILLLLFLDLWLKQSRHTR